MHRFDLPVLLFLSRLPSEEILRRTQERQWLPWHRDAR